MNYTDNNHDEEPEPNWYAWAFIRVGLMVSVPLLVLGGVQCWSHLQCYKQPTKKLEVGYTPQKQQAQSPTAAKDTINIETLLR